MQVILGVTTGEEPDNLYINIWETVGYFALRLVAHDRKAEQTMIRRTSPSMNMRVYRGHSKSNRSIYASFDA